MTAFLRFYTWGSRNVKFMLIPEEDAEIELLALQYQKTAR